MDKVRKIIQEEIQTLLHEEGHFSDNNYGLPKTFNILNFAQAMEKEASDAKEVLVQLMKLLGDKSLDSESKVAQANEMIFSWYNQAT